MTTNFGKFWNFFSTKMEFTYIQKKGTPRATTKNILQLKFLSFFSSSQNKKFFIHGEA